MDSISRFVALFVCVVSLMLLPKTTQAQQADTRSALLYFTTPGCYWCQVVAPKVSELQRAGYPIVKIDGSQRRDLTDAYHVRAFPTFVLVINGQIAERVEGDQEKSTLEAMAGKASVAMKETEARLASSSPTSKTNLPVTSEAESSRTQLIATELIAAGMTGLERPVLGSAAAFPGAGLGTAEARPRSASQQSTSQPTARQGVVTLVGRDVTPAAKPGLLTKLGLKADGETTGSVVYRGNNEMDDVARQGEMLTQSPAAGAAIRIRVHDQKGETFGSGTIVESRYGRAVILTCGHVLRGIGEKGNIEVDVFSGNEPKTYVAQMIDADLDADVGLISIPCEQQLPIALIAGSEKTLSVGNEMFSIGCSAGSPPSKEVHRVTALNKYRGPETIECSGAPVQGRSGGGLFDRHQQVAGVCILADPKENLGIYCGLPPIHAILRKNSLGHLLGESAQGSETTIAFGESTNSNNGVLNASAQNTNSQTARENAESNPWAGQTDVAPVAAVVSPGLMGNRSVTEVMPFLDPQSREILNQAKGAKLTIIIETADQQGQPKVVVIPVVSASLLAELQGETLPTEPMSKLQMTSGRVENKAALDVTTPRAMPLGESTNLGRSTGEMYDSWPAAGSGAQTSPAPRSPTPASWPPARLSESWPETSMNSDSRVPRTQQTSMTIQKYTRAR